MLSSTLGVICEGALGSVCPSPPSMPSKGPSEGSSGNLTVRSGPERGGLSGRVLGRRCPRPPALPGHDPPRRIASTQGTRPGGSQTVESPVRAAWKWILELERSTDRERPGHGNRNRFLADSGRGETASRTSKHALRSGPGQMLAAARDGVSSENPPGVVKQDDLGKLKRPAPTGHPLPRTHSSASVSARTRRYMLNLGRMNSSL